MSYDPLDKFSVHDDDIVVTRRVPSDTLLADEMVAQAVARVRAGEDLEAVALELAHLEVGAMDLDDLEEEWVRETGGFRGAEFDPSQPRDPAGTPTGGQWTSGGGGLTKNRTVSDEELRKRAVAASVAQLVHSTYSDSGAARVSITPEMTPEDRLAVVVASQESYKEFYVRKDRYDYASGGARRFREFEEEAKAKSWSNEEIMEKALERGLISRTKSAEFSGGLPSSYPFKTSEIVGGLDGDGRDRFEQVLVQQTSPDFKWYPNTEDLVNVGWTTTEMERLADRVQEAGGKYEQWGDGKYRGLDALAGEVAYYSKDYDTFRTAAFNGWSVSGSSLDSKTLRSVAERAFPIEGGGEYYRPQMSSYEKALRGSYDPATAFSQRAVDNMHRLREETRAFYAAKFKGADPSTKPLEVVRGVGGRVQAYTPGAIESWSTDKNTAKRFGKMMATGDDYSVLSTRVTYADIIWSWQSAAGRPGWPAEKDLKGKKEFVLLGSRVRNVGVVHGRAN